MTVPDEGCDKRNVALNCLVRCSFAGVLDRLKEVSFSCQFSMPNNIHDYGLGYDRYYSHHNIIVAIFKGLVL